MDVERSIYYVQFCHAEIEEVYLELFDEALERYNAKQKRNDRKIDNYYEKIRRGKQDKLFHKAVFQIGNRDDMNAKSEEGGLAKEILIEYMKNFQKRNPYLHAFSAHLHMDEETPHVHVDFVPAVCNSKRGLDTRVSLEGALGEQGFKSGTRGATEWNQWIESVSYTHLAISFTRSCFGVLDSDSYCAIRTSEVFPRKPRRDVYKRQVYCS